MTHVSRMEMNKEQITVELCAVDSRFQIGYTLFSEGHLSSVTCDTDLDIFKEPTCNGTLSKIDQEVL